MMRKAKFFGILSLAIGILATASTQTAVDKLRSAGGMSFRLNDGQYTIKLGTDCSVSFAEGSLGAQAPLNVQFGEHGSGTGLDFQVRITDIVNSIQATDLVTFRAEVLGSNEIRWTANQAYSPVICTIILISGSPNLFEIGRVFASLRYQISEGDCFGDPLEFRPCGVTLTLTPVGGDAENNLGFDGFAPVGGEGNDCSAYPVHVPACARAFTLQQVAYGGGLSAADGDVNSDCVVDDADLLIVLFAFGSDDEEADANGDGIVDDSDLLVVLFSFGVSC